MPPPTDLDEGVTFLVIALHSKNGVSWAAGPDVHFRHLFVEELGEILLVNICGDATDIQSAGLTRKVRVASDPHTKRLNRHGRRQSGDGEDRWNLGSVRSREVEETY